MPIDGQQAKGYKYAWKKKGYIHSGSQRNHVGNKLESNITQHIEKHLCHQVEDSWTKYILK